MDIPTKIKLAETYAKMSEAEVARKLGTSSQAFGQRLKTGKFTSAELDRIAGALGAEFVCCFRFPDGTEI
ncbi:MAG TPA: XRE family transcriptional regulator [Candidatus Scatomorpha merdigallinarum]|nr:XRE family transcriptional regulator [Candidatus Scatomorpha merdigallinarum]